MKHITTYLNYRDLIRDYYNAKKAEDPKFSYNLFADKIGLNAKTYLLHVISGKKRLSNSRVFGLATAMDLSRIQTEYLEALVVFNNAKTAKERDFAWERLKTIAGKAGTTKTKESQLSHFSKWYQPVIRELLTMEKFDGSYEALARRVKPAITTKQAQEAVIMLLKAGLLKRAKPGRYKKAEPKVKAKMQMPESAAAAYQEQVMSLGTEALSSVPAEEREITALTAGISEDCFRTIRQELQKFQSYLLGIIKGDKKASVVYQLNVQLFPLSSKPSKSKSGPKARKR